MLASQTSLQYYLKYGNTFYCVCIILIGIKKKVYKYEILFVTKKNYALQQLNC